MFWMVQELISRRQRVADNLGNGINDAAHIECGSGQLEKEARKLRSCPLFREGLDIVSDGLHVRIATSRAFLHHGLQIAEKNTGTIVK